MSAAERTLLLDAFDSNWVAPLGPHVDAFEREFAELLGVRHAVALSSGTAALHLALILMGVQPGDEVISPTFTFVATANAISYCHANPVFLDSDDDSWNMDAKLLELELEDCRRRGKLPKAVMVVDINGQCADYEGLLRVCNNYGVPVIEDAAEALGATRHGRPAGTFGEIGCFSFNGNKIITCSGGGMLVTDKQEWADRARFLATQAREQALHYEHSVTGFNYRLSNLLAAVGRGQLSVLSERVARRRYIFEHYRSQLGGLPGFQFMPEPDGAFSTRWLTSLLVDEQQANTNRDCIIDALAAHGIEARPLWKPMHMQPLFRECRYRGQGVSERLFAKGICLPSGTGLQESDLDQICDLIRGTIGRGCLSIEGH